RSVAAMLFAAGLHWGYFAAGAAALAPLVGLLIVLTPYRTKRLEAFLDPWKDPLGKGFQIIQSYIAVGTGGIDVVGLMEGKQQLFFLPQPHTDFIFAVIGEELGFIGALFVLALFGVILWRGLRAAAVCPNEFGRLLAIGLTVLVVGQALVNISVVLGLLPTQGMALAPGGCGGSCFRANVVGGGVPAGGVIRGLGTARGLEARLIPAAGFPLRTVAAAGLVGIAGWKKLRNLFVLPRTLVETSRFLRQFGPDVVLGMGGYLAGPVML